MTTDVRTPQLLSPALLRCFAAIAASAIAFYLPLSVVPMLAEQSGSAGAGNAGLATVALLLATVAAGLATPRLVSRVGYRSALGIGLVLLGAPTIALTVSDSTAVIIAVSVVRGAGFAICAVITNAITAKLIPADRRGEGLALAGVVCGLPNLLALPAGVWVATHWGFAPVFAVAAAVPLGAVLCVPGLPRFAAPVTTGSGQSVIAGLRNAMLVRPSLIFAVSTAAAGVLVTFLPLAVGGASACVAVAALLAQPAAATLARWVAGRLGDRYGNARQLAPGLLLAATGMAALACTSVPAAVIGGALVFGAGFGVLQNATLTLMYAHAADGGEGAVSAIWNAAYDLGMAAGALGAGLVAASAGYPAAFLLTAVVMLPAFVLIRRDRSAGDGTCR
ncbi:MFS transporter [Actinoplanes sp. NBC_00393]|uniref:MFS transporter n=1 Tax=Actinoplanes sp. NBC_00393 TaxID=2975953 RepID=UPI002E1D717D